MPLVPRPFPPALRHGDIREVLPDVFFVTGALMMPAALPVRVSRNMTIVREGERLVLINSVRLNDEGLAALDKLGKVTDIVRIAGNHGMDDPFYRDRYEGSRVWAVKGQRYTAGFEMTDTTYFEPDDWMTSETKLPIEGARLHVIASGRPESLLLLPHKGGTLVAGDCLQHWATTDPYFNFVGRVSARVLGFIKPFAIGPAWLRQGKPPKEHLRAILDLDFANVMPAHGAAVIGGAKESYRPAIDRATTAL